MAKRLGVSPPRITALKKKGRVKMIGSVIDEDATERMHRERIAAQQPSRYRKIKQLYDAKMAKLDYDKAVSSVLDKAQVEKDAFRIARIVRDTLMRLPDRLAGVLASETNQNKIHAILTTEIRQALEALSGAAPVGTT
jgi:predicted oxidoreductase